MTCQIENSSETIVLTATFDVEDNFEQSIEQNNNFVIHNDELALDLIEFYETIMM